MDPQKVEISWDGDTVTGLFIRPSDAKALYLFAHGAGAGMAHKAMTSSAEGLAERGIATLRFNFPYMEKGSKRPDAPKVAHAAIRAAAAKANELAPKLPLFAGGRSFGGRMTSQAQAIDPLAKVRGLAFLGFPLHPAGKPATDRADRLADVRVPMLFVTGSKDALGDLDLLRPIVAGLGDRATLHIVEHADHSFKTAVKSGRTSAQAEAEALDALAGWIGGKLGS